MDGKIRTFRDLLVWQKAMVMVTEVYRLSRGFPKDELYALTSQLRRCAVSIPSNIAEGFGRHSTNDYIRYLRMSMGSLCELQTQLEIAQNLEYLGSGVTESIQESAREIERMLSSLLNKLQNQTSE